MTEENPYSDILVTILETSSKVYDSKIIKSGKEYEYAEIPIKHYKGEERKVLYNQLAGKLFQLSQHNFTSDLIEVIALSENYNH